MRATVARRETRGSPTVSVIVRFDGYHLSDGVGIVAEVQAITGADLDHPTGQPGQHSIAVLGRAAPFRLGADPLIRPREPRMLKMRQVTHTVLAYFRIATVFGITHTTCERLMRRDRRRTSHDRPVNINTVPIALGDSGRYGGQNSSSSSMNAVGS